MKNVLSQQVAASILLSYSASAVDAKSFSCRIAFPLGRINKVNPIAGLGLVQKQKRQRSQPKEKQSKFSGPSLFNDELCDCFENDIHSPATMYAQSSSIVELDGNGKTSQRDKSFLNRVQNMIRECYFACPGEAYHRPQGGQQEDILFTSLRTLKKRVEDIVPKKQQSVKEETASEIAGGEPLLEPSAEILSSVTKPLIPTNIWKSLTGKEFFFPSTLSGLVQTGIRTVLPQSSEYIDWKPADSKTKKLLDLNDNEVIRNALEDDDVLVWIGKFKDEGHGSHLPLVKTTSILPLAPRDMAALLMDSSRVQSYNKMSLGRNDEVVFQAGIDTEAESADGSAMMIDGEAKIVRNLTKPPLTKKLMEFVTVMYARRLKAEDNVGVGIMGGNHEDGYAVVSRAVSGGKWGGCTEEGEESERTRSEILLGMNLIRMVPGEENKSEVTAVTHCNSPSVPKMLAGSVGVKGAVDFVKDIRAMFG